MAFGGFTPGGPKLPNAEINMVPLIDVMLVLLVIFIIAAPLLTHAVKVDLPRVTSEPNQTRSDNVQLGLRATGEIYWNGEPIERGAIAERMRDAATTHPQPELHIHADRTTEYRHVAEVLGHAAKAGLTQVGFVSDPQEQAP
jgi:biopolymer transport protein ExbD